MGNKYKVCSESYQSVNSISRRRLNLLTLKFHQTQRSPRESRGCAQITEKDEEISNLPYATFNHLSVKSLTTLKRTPIDLI